MRIVEWDHLAIEVQDLTRALAFYVGVLGMKVDELASVAAFEEGRFPYVRVRTGRGYLYLFPPSREGQVAAGSGQPLGWHFALTVAASSGEAVKARLEAAGVAPHRGPELNLGSRGMGWAVYCRDPDGNEVELKCYPADVTT